MWLFLLAARHKMQALSALACSVGCAFSGFASLKIALFIQPYNKAGTHFTFGSPAFFVNCLSASGRAPVAVFRLRKGIR